MAYVDELTRNNFENNEELLVEQLRLDFPSLNKLINGKKYIYLDNAATSQKPKTVIESINNFYENYNSNINSGNSFSNRASKLFEQTRYLVKEFINAKNLHNIIYTSGATESINIAANSLFFSNFFNENDEIILTMLEHNSSLLPWLNIAKIKNLKIKIAQFNELGIVTTDEIENLITKKTKIIISFHTSHLLGVTQDIKAITQLAHKYNIPTLIDAAQSVPHIKVDVQEIGCDFLVFSGHKMLAPTGTGILYISDNILDRINVSSKIGGHTIEGINLKNNKDISYQLLPAPNKFEAGTPNISGIIGLGEAIKYINKIGIDFITASNKKLINYAMNKLKEIEQVEFTLNEKVKRYDLISFNLKKIHAHDAITFFDSMGIIAKSGKLCAHLAFYNKNLLKNKQAIRISFYFYNTKYEIDKLIEVIKKTIEAF